MSEHRSALLNLPYDVRHLIYQQLFPPLRQIYILAGDRTLQLVNHHHTVHTSIFQVNRTLGKEASEYFYSRYLFNIVGRKQDCLNLYKPFLETFSKHAREQAQVHPFTNGAHSNTSCISIQAGQSQLKTLQSRRRGKPRTIDEIQHEIEASLSQDTAFDRSLRYLKHIRLPEYLHVIVLAIVVAVLAIVLV